MPTPLPTDINGAPPTGVMTVDDQAVFRAVVRDVVRASPGFELLGEASSGAEAVTLFRALLPDLVLMDVRMPGMDGMEATRGLRSIRADAVVVLISVEDVRDMAGAAQDCGAVALLRKQDLCPRVLADLWATHGCC